MARATSAATATWASIAPRARELAGDPEFRSHATEVIAAADRLRGMLRGGDRRLIAQRLIDDQDVQREIGLLVGEARAAADRARRKRRSRLPRLLLVLGIAAIAVPVVRMLLQKRRQEPGELQSA